MTPSLQRAEWPGTYGPAPATPPRIVGSVRRTTTVDMLRPEGLDGPLVLSGRGRDLVTHADGTTLVADVASFQATIDYVHSRRVLALRTDPPEPSLDELVGRRASSGFRRSIDELLAHRRGSVLFLLLDDVPVTALISGNVLSLSGRSVEALGPLNAPPADVCAGWRAGGVMPTAVAETGTGLNVLGPLSPPLADPADPIGWHALDPLPPGSMRRARRIDVHLDPSSGMFAIDSTFRDLLVEDDGAESAVHEYDVTGCVDPRRRVLVDVAALPRVLPGPECPAAAASALRVNGLALATIRDVVRDELTGTSTCTHLNDALRALGDVDALLALLPARG